MQSGEDSSQSFSTPVRVVTLDCGRYPADVNTGAPKPLPGLPPPWWERWAWGCVVLVLLAISAAYAYFTIFSRFRSYDDEGFILISLRSYFLGHALYDQVYSCYQPGFYVFDWLVFTLSGAALGHDNIRLLTLVLWLIAAALNGLVVHGLTGNKVLAALTLVLSLRVLDQFANEPGHPQALAGAGVTGLAALFAWNHRLAPRLLAAAAGALTGFLLLIKVNVGIYALLPVMLIFAAGANPKYRLGLMALVGSLMLALPALLMRVQLFAKPVSLGCTLIVEALGIAILISAAFLRHGLRFTVAFLLAGCVGAVWWIGTYSVELLAFFSAGLITLSMVCVLSMFLSERDAFPPLARDWIWAVGGGVLIFAGVVLTLLVQGTSVLGLIRGTFVLPAKQSGIFFVRWTSNALGLWLALGGAAASYGWIRLRSTCRDTIWYRACIVLAKLIFGLCVLLEFYGRPADESLLKPFQPGWPHFWMLPFCWLLVVPVPRPATAVMGRFALLALAVIQPLIAYPVAGTQLSPASILLLPLGVVCLADACRLAFEFPIFAWLLDPPRLRWVRWSAGVVCLAALLTLLGREADARHQTYAALTPLGFPGATRVHLPAEQVGLFRQITERLASPASETFLTLPGLNSFYFWAQKEPPSSLNTTTWMTLLDGTEQEHVWKAAQDKRGLMVVRNQSLAAHWLRSRTNASFPLARHINDEFGTIYTNSGYEVMVRR